MNLESMLKEFITKFDIPKGEFTDNLVNERIEMLKEELEEIIFAADNWQEVEFLDGLVDLVYFAVGTAVILDYKFNEAFKRVHEANMQKVRAHTERSAVDLIKPPGWVKPNLKDLI